MFDIDETRDFLLIQKQAWLPAEYNMHACYVISGIAVPLKKHGVFMNFFYKIDELRNVLITGFDKKCAVHFFNSYLEEQNNLCNQSYIVTPYSFYQNVF